MAAVRGNHSHEAVERKAAAMCLDQRLAAVTTVAGAVTARDLDQGVRKRSKGWFTHYVPLQSQ